MAKQAYTTTKKDPFRDALVAFLHLAPFLSQTDWEAFPPGWKEAYEAAKDLSEDKFRFAEDGRALPNKLNNVGIYGALEIMFRIGALLNKQEKPHE